MKKALRTTTVLMLTLVCCIAFAACGHEHTFSTDWSQDGENHWHACTGKDCNEASDKAAHVYDNACDADCDECGATRTPAAHVYDNACDADCNECGATRTPAAHVYDGEADAACNECGAERTLSTRYQAKDETEWNAAFDFARMTRFSVVGGTSTKKLKIVRDGDVILLEGYMKGDSGEVKLLETYYVKDGDNYYTVDWNASAGAIYERKAISKDDYEEMFDNVLSITVGDSSFSDFTFDGASNKYSNADATLTHTLTYVGGVLTKIEATAPNGDPTDTETVSTTVTFEKTTLTVPSSHAFAYSSDAKSHWYACTDKDCTVIKDKADHSFTDQKDETQHWKECLTCGYQQEKITATITAARYENAMNFKDEEGKYYSNLSITRYTHSGTLTHCYTVTENAAYVYSTSQDAESLVTIWTNENARGVIYTKKNASSQWVRTEYTTGEFNDFAAFVSVADVKSVLSKLSFEALTYNKNDQMYHGSYTFGSYTINVSLSFENGKLVKMSSSAEASSVLGGTTTVTYGNAVIELPETDEVGKSIAVVPYNGNGGFEIDARLSAGDNWFVFDITSEMIAEYSNEMNATFTVPDGGADLTITLKAYDKSDTELTNDATDGNLYAEDLTAGKYYLKITVNKACIGSLKVTIAV